MKRVRAVVASLALGILILPMVGQSTNGYQSLGGDYGMALINEFNAEKPAVQAQKSGSTSLWDWGNAPKGSEIVNGKLQNGINVTQYYLGVSNWLGDAYVDPYTSKTTYQNHYDNSKSIYDTGAFPGIITTSNGTTYYSLPMRNYLPKALGGSASGPSSASSSIDPWA